MKTFFAACAALAAVVAVVIASSVMTIGLTDSLTELAETLPECADEKNSGEILGVLDKISELWESRRFAVSLSVGHRELEEIESALKTAEASVKALSPGDYAVAVSTFKQKLRYLSESEKISLDGIL